MSRAFVEGFRGLKLVIVHRSRLRCAGLSPLPCLYTSRAFVEGFRGLKQKLECLDVVPDSLEVPIALPLHVPRVFSEGGFSPRGRAPRGAGLKRIEVGRIWSSSPQLEHLTRDTLFPASV